MAERLCETPEVLAGKLLSRRAQRPELDQLDQRSEKAGHGDTHLQSQSSFGEMETLQDS